MPVTFLRPGWFMENAAWDVAAARERRDPQLSAAARQAGADGRDGGCRRVAAELLQENWDGRRVVELEGPHRVTPNEIAADLREDPRPSGRAWSGAARELGRPLQGAGHEEPDARIQMLDGFNQGWIEFETGQAGSIKGNVELETVLRRLAGNG